MSRIGSMHCSRQRRTWSPYVMLRKMPMQCVSPSAVGESRRTSPLVFKSKIRERFLGWLCAKEVGILVNVHLLVHIWR